MTIAISIGILTIALIGAGFGVYVMLKHLIYEILSIYEFDFEDDD